MSLTSRVSYVRPECQERTSVDMATWSVTICSSIIPNEHEWFKEFFLVVGTVVLLSLFILFSWIILVPYKWTFGNCVTVRSGHCCRLVPFCPETSSDKEDVVDYVGAVHYINDITGILEREQEQSVVYGSIDFGKTIVSHDKYKELVSAVSSIVHCGP